MTACIFCKIIERALPCTPLLEDEHLLVIDDINPIAPVHKLIIPKKHIATLNDLGTEDTLLMGHLLTTGAKLAQTLGIAEEGYRLVENCNAGAGQTVYHIHFHLLGGRSFHWPPG
ncbi:MAG: histidine triad nucleotide-binding protein [Gammaproteobacteria bacterium]|nr:histidine triad nucleotide-binding protein [Gammaproteobacteria bacterium]